MTPREIGVVLMGETFVVLALIGLIVRGRWRLSWFFTAYVAAAFVCEALVTLWPSRFWALWFWVLKQASYDVLKLCFALEIAWRTFGPFPGAGLAIRRVACVVLLATAFTVLTLPLDGASPTINRSIFATVHPRIANGTIWLMLGIFGLARWYRVPVHPFHGAVMTGFVVYLAIFSSENTLAHIYGFDSVWPYLRAFDPVAYCLLVVWWTHVIWRPDAVETRAHMETLQHIQARTT
jgi:hypothetical protein